MEALVARADHSFILPEAPYPERLERRFVPAGWNFLSPGIDVGSLVNPTTQLPHCPRFFPPLHLFSAKDRKVHRSGCPILLLGLQTFREPRSLYYPQYWRDPDPGDTISF